MKKFDLFKSATAAPHKNMDALKNSALTTALLNKVKGGESGSGSNGDGESGCDRRRRTGGG